MKYAAIATILSFVAIYLGDYAMARSKPLGSVQVQPFYAIHQKDGKTEFDYSVPPETQTAWRPCCRTWAATRAGTS